MKGSYILILRIPESREHKIGKLGTIPFRKGYYAYVGSAMNNIEKRVTRHCSQNKHFHWHIDYLLTISKIEHILYRESEKKEECDIAEKLNEHFPSIAGFGSSDCCCRSHLFFCRSKTQLLETCRAIGMTDLL